MKTYIALVLITSIISSSIVGGILYSSFSAKLNSQAAAQTSSALFTNNGNSAQAVKTGTTSSSNGNMYSAVDIAKKVGPSIVGVRMTVTSSISQYFRGGNQQQDTTSEGSGIIISSDGYIMTNYHVVEYADPKSGVSSQALLEVFLPDGKQAQAKFIGGDDENDLAVIKVNLTNLPVAELGDSSKLEVGEPAVAIGNPLGMEFAGSVTVGVISALNRQVETEDKTLNLIQTDAAINPGNSGGALVNSKGQVIGINTVKISETGVEGLGFAIPVNDAKPIVQQLVKYGYVKGRPFIGISGQEITQVMSARYGLPVGIYIVDVTSGSGAQKAGIEKGDVLVSLAGKAVKTMSDVNTIKKGYKAGDTVDAVIVRN
ncbi:MAG TPA: peptidase S1, partial [Clostridiaceae bacterium]|nr:peptidase S1 [Clostridiaceae bacterium]